MYIYVSMKYYKENNHDMDTIIFQKNNVYNTVSENENDFENENEIEYDIPINIQDLNLDKREIIIHLHMRGPFSRGFWDTNDWFDFKPIKLSQTKLQLFKYRIKTNIVKYPDNKKPPSNYLSLKSSLPKHNTLMKNSVNRKEKLQEKKILKFKIDNLHLLNPIFDLMVKNPNTNFIIKFKN